MFEIGLVALLVVYTLVASISVLATKRPALQSRQRRQIEFIIGGHIVLLAGLAYLIWPLSAPGREPALQTVDEFMTALSLGEFESALQMTTQDWGEDYTAIAETFQIEESAGRMGNDRTRFPKYFNWNSHFL